jgi:hypothetical protein
MILLTNRLFKLYKYQNKKLLYKLINFHISIKLLHYGLVL